MEIINSINRVKHFAEQTPDKVMFVDNNASRKTTYAEFWILTLKIASKIMATKTSQPKVFFLTAWNTLLRNWLFG